MSLYLKYRPQDFINLVWQDFIKETLQKAITYNKTVWAYLLCWPRWTWKTSTARILAKTINCLNPGKWNPCLKCEICVDFLDEKLIDIVEIDAASHTWVDNIRDLILKAQFSPTKTKYKVYIIDEVHMLTKWAFNALLKTLEEPPSHVKFILATTETHKVPETIISRCQRYDFKRISNIDIEKRLEYISINEKIKIDKKSLDYIVNNSWGWLRNAISTFEQLISWNEINFDMIINNLWIVWDEELENFLDKLLNCNNDIINDFEQLIIKWNNIKLFFKELIFFTKNKTLQKIKKWDNILTLIKILEILDETYTKTKFSMDENITFLIWILNIININNKVNINDGLNSNRNINKENIKKTTNNEKIIDNNIDNWIIAEKWWKVWNENEKSNENKKSSITKNDVNIIFNRKKDLLQDVWNTHKSPVINDINKDFDLNRLIDELKKQWAKWALTMAIRWSIISLIWSTLNIITKTNISKIQISSIENSNLIKNALNIMWISEPNLNINK